jgi:hypothetical protein
MELNSDYTLPIICISIYKNKVIFTTKKVGSRYFEDITTDSNNPHKKVSIDFKILTTVSSDTPYDARLQLGKYYFKPFTTRYLSVDDFFTKLNIRTISELFTDIVMDTHELVLVVRDPIKRTLTGFIEIVDSYLVQLMAKPEAKHIISEFFQIEMNKDLRGLSDENVLKILNFYATNIGADILTDSHVSGWNIFMLNFIEEFKIKNKIKVIDLEDVVAMAGFPKIEQPSNKSYLKMWLDIEEECKANTLLQDINFFLIKEIEAYHQLSQLK